MSTTNYERIEWLQLSDLHVFSEADTASMLRSFRKLALDIHPQFIVVTGDYRHLKYNTDYNLSCEYLSNIVEIFNVNKKDVFLVPGNHDVNTGKHLERDGAISNILDSMNRQHTYSPYIDYLDTLRGAFEEYKDFVSLFYKDVSLDEDDTRIKEPESVFCSVWGNRINLLHVNTAIISDGKKDAKGNRVHPEILDINELSDILRSIDNHLPTIVLAHHGIESLHERHKERIEGMLMEGLFSAYLHGDIHVHRENPIRSEDPRCFVPQIACGKSAPQDGDNYSDLGVVFYSWRPDDEVEVYIYHWTPTHGFARYCQYPIVHGTNNEPYTFPMRYEKNISPTTEEVAHYVETENKLAECVHMIVAGNHTLKRRDKIDYNADDWIKLYSFPKFSGNKRSPIPDSRPFRTIVVAPSGNGKSVMLQGLALLYAQKQLSNSLPLDYQALDDAFGLGKNLFPISIRARDYNVGESTKSILDYAVCSVQDESERLCIDRKIMETMCTRGEVVLLIDSLDEVYENKVNDFIGLINAHILAFPKTNIIITSRNIPGLRQLPHFSPIKLCKFGREQIFSQIEKRSFENATLIKKRITNDTYLTEMASSPIMLVTMLSHMSSTPEAGTVVEYLKEITESIIKQRWGDFDLLNGKDKDMQALLSGLAWGVLCNNQYGDGIPKDELYRKVQNVFSTLEKTGYSFEWRPDSEVKPAEERLNQLVTDLGRRSGILNLDDGNMRYVFQDRLVKWYLGASYVKRLFYESENRRGMSTAEVLIQLDRQLNLIPLKGELVHTLVMSISLLQAPQQQALLQFLLLRATCSTDDDEIRAINEGLVDLIKNTFGINSLFNPRVYSTSWELPSVIRWLRHNGDTETMEILRLKFPEYCRY